MIKVSANLGFLWQELSLPDAIRAASSAGFDAVECHWPYAVPIAEVNAALAETELPMIGLNSSRGNAEAGENGLCALPDRVDDARQTIDEAIAYASAINTGNIHIMAGFADGQKAHDTFVSNLQYAATQTAGTDITLLIEPLNHYDAPGYFLQTSDQAVGIIDAVGVANLKLMFDCYHLQIMEGDLTRRLHALAAVTGHIQIASVPARAEPDTGELNYAHLLAEIERSGYTGYVGAEYKPMAGTQAGLGWMNTLKR